MLVRSVSEKEAQLKQRTAQPTDKEVLFGKVQELFEKSQSLKHFKSLLKQKGIHCYDRTGKLCGVYYGKRRYRLKRSLGIDIDQLLLKTKSQERRETLSKLRQQKSRSKGLDRER